MSDGSQGINSAMLASMSKHAGGPEHSATQPVTHAQNIDAGWKTPVFQDNLELFPGANEAKLDLGGISGNMDLHGIFALLAQESALNTDAAGVFDGTILSNGNINHPGYNLKLSGDTALGNKAPMAQLNMGDGFDIPGKGGGAGPIV